MDSSSQKPLQYSARYSMPAATAALIVALTFCVAFPDAAMASTSSLPWDGPIERIANGLQGPVAFLFALGGMIVLGVRWIFGG